MASSSPPSKSCTSGAASAGSSAAMVKRPGAALCRKLRSSHGRPRRRSRRSAAFPRGSPAC
eukprot:3069322-Lingulodinium_polyedra.AAC.1